MVVHRPAPLSPPALTSAAWSTITHEIRSPLAAVVASASSLRDYSDRFDEDTRHDLLNAICQETERLAAQQDNLVSLGRLESDSLMISPASMRCGDAVESALARLSKLGVPSPVWSPPAADPLISTDAVHLRLALFNLMQHAARRSLDDTPPRIFAGERDGRAEIVILDDNGGPADATAERMFDPPSRDDPPIPRNCRSDLGTYVARRLLEAMQASVTAAPRLDGAPGLSVTVSLPLAHGSETAP